MTNGAAPPRPVTVRTSAVDPAFVMVAMALRRPNSGRVSGGREVDESIRCPMCGSSGATRTGTVSEYDERFEAGQITPRRDLISRTDQLQCERCGGTWDEVADIQAKAGIPRVGCATRSRARA
jgi:DNA-directed RNA polymerase subunit RPC12/RpoP